MTNTWITEQRDTTPALRAALKANRRMVASRKAGFEAWKRGRIADAIATWDAEDMARGFCLVAPARIA